MIKIRINSQMKINFKISKKNNIKQKEEKKKKMMMKNKKLIQKIQILKIWILNKDNKLSKC